MRQSQAFYQLTAQGEHRELVYKDIRTFQISILLEITFYSTSWSSNQEKKNPVLSNCTAEMHPQV